MELELPWSERQQEVLGNQRRVGGNRGGGKRDWLEVGRAWLSLSRKKVMKMRPDDRALCPAEDSDLDPVVCGETDPAAEPREEGPRGQLTS